MTSPAKRRPYLLDADYYRLGYQLAAQHLNRSARREQGAQVAANSERLDKRLLALRDAALAARADGETRTLRRHAPAPDLHACAPDDPLLQHTARLRDEARVVLHWYGRRRSTGAAWLGRWERRPWMAEQWIAVRDGPRHVVASLQLVVWLGLRPLLWLSTLPLRLVARWRRLSPQEESLCTFLSETIEPCCTLLAARRLLALGMPDDAERTIRPLLARAKADAGAPARRRADHRPGSRPSGPALSYRAYYALACMEANTTLRDDESAIEHLGRAVQRAPRDRRDELARWAEQDPAFLRLRDEVRAKLDELDLRPVDRAGGPGTPGAPP